ncbi:MAG: DUF4339 domain-containing protein [Deltaproteobacteria bacterium]|nr:DUF4339 domain-containing protein [Deltaproteobacteria bacterium]
MADIYIRTRSTNYGPYSEDELRSHVKSGRQAHPDYEPKPEAKPDAGSSTTKLEAAGSRGGGGTGATVSAEPVWFYIREKKKFGPFSAAELVGQLQRKALDATTFVWRPGFETWQKMAHVSEFSRDAMKRLASEGAPVDILVKRKFSRTPYEVEVIAHDNTRAIEGRTMVIGEGGLFLATARPSHKLGARLKLHFREGDTPAFNAVAEVVSVVRGEMPGYCLRFVALSDTDRRRIAKFVTERKTK